MQSKLDKLKSEKKVQMAEIKITHMTKEIKKLTNGYKERCNELKIKDELLKKTETTCET